MARTGIMLRILGIDPSLTSSGYAVLDFNDGQFSVIDYGEIKTTTRNTLSERLVIIFNTITDLLTRHKPDEVAVEEVFYAANPKIALNMGHARGVSLVAAAIHRLPISEYSAREIKMAVTGYGNASKDQVRRMILAQINVENKTIGFDIADAMAVAICHCHRLKNADSLNRKSS